MRARSRGVSLVEVTLALAVVTVLSAGLFAKYRAQQVVAETRVTRENAQALLHASLAYWSRYRAAPPNMAALIAERFLDSASLPVNPLGGPFSVRVDPLGGGVSRVVVSAPITAPGNLVDWRRSLEANTVVAGGLEWHRIVRESGTMSGIRNETFRSMY